MPTKDFKFFKYSVSNYGGLSMSMHMLPAKHAMLPAKHALLVSMTMTKHALPVSMTAIVNVDSEIIPHRLE
jgi:hypothetical protein